MGMGIRTPPDRHYVDRLPHIPILGTHARMVRTLDHAVRILRLCRLLDIRTRP